MSFRVGGCLRQARWISLEEWLSLCLHWPDLFFSGWLCVRWLPALACNSCTVYTLFFISFLLSQCSGLLTCGVLGLFQKALVDGGLHQQAVFYHQIVLHHLSGWNSPLCFIEMPDRTSKAPSWTIAGIHFCDWEGGNREINAPSGSNHLQLRWCSRRHLGFGLSYHVLCYGTLCTVVCGIHWPEWRGFNVWQNHALPSRVVEAQVVGCPELPPTTLLLPPPHFLPAVLSRSVFRVCTFC